MPTFLKRRSRQQRPPPQQSGAFPTSPAAMSTPSSLPLGSFPSELNENPTNATTKIMRRNHNLNSMKSNIRRSIKLKSPLKRMSFRNNNNNNNHQHRSSSGGSTRTNTHIHNDTTATTEAAAAIRKRTSSSHSSSSSSTEVMMIMNNESLTTTTAATTTGFEALDHVQAFDFTPLVTTSHNTNTNNADGDDWMESLYPDIQTSPSKQSTISTFYM
mmetsp:Transcript_24724/g.69409  ORF Transcript_24724/g.69409 Transcript_24724/m.69409 type:complete len:215 (+) Transcript_24724:602-1246(+)